MLSELSSEDKVGEVFMAHRHPKFKNKIFLIVEGISDVKLFSHIIDEDMLQIEASYGGKENLIKIISQLYNLGDQRVIGICDADFDRLDSTHDLYHDKHIYMTDAHDIETMMILSRSKKKIISEFCKPEITRDVERNFDNICIAAYEIGIFRWINKNEGGSEGLRLNFKGLRFNRLFSFDHFKFRFELHDFIRDLIERSSDIDNFVTVDFLEEKYHQYKSKKAPYEQICCGHDISELACVFINQNGFYCGRKISSSIFESALRTSYEKSFFVETELYQLFSRSFDEKKELLG